MKKQVLVIHGGDFYDTRKQFVAALKKETLTRADLTRSFTKRWKDNLGSDLGTHFEVLQPSMPLDRDAKYPEWKMFFEKIIPFLEDGVVLIGHSLGGIFLARYLSEQNMPVKVSALFLIAAPYFLPDTKRGMRANAGFTLKKTLQRVSKQVPVIHVYHSSDDAIVPVAHATRYQKALPGAQVTILSGLGHFRMEHFPELIAAIRSL